MGEQPARRTWKRILLLMGVLAITGIGASAMMLSSWTEIRAVGAARIAGAFAEAGPADRRPYVTIEESGRVAVDRSLELSTRTRLRALHVMTWHPSDEKLVRIDLPWWFVRPKMTGTLNLGTITTALARDWVHLDLDVTEGDLEHRGPGVVLDHARVDGLRILVWTSAAREG